jgi:hypothetical protein
MITKLKLITEANFPSTVNVLNHFDITTSVTLNFQHISDSDIKLAISHLCLMKCMGPEVVASLIIKQCFKMSTPLVSYIFYFLIYV